MPARDGCQRSWTNATVTAKTPGVTRPWTKRQKTTWLSVRAVDASSVAAASANAAATMTRRLPHASARLPTNGAAMATASVVAVTVRLTAKWEAPKTRWNSGSSGCGA